MENELQFQISPYTSFVLTIRSPLQEKNIFKGLNIFYLFLVSMMETSKSDVIHSMKRAKSDLKWLTNNVVRYLHINWRRVEKREISASTGLQ